MVSTALMLGAMVVAAGAYGLLYCVARLHGSPMLSTASRASCVALVALAAAIVALTPLHFGWKALIVASARGLPGDPADHVALSDPASSRRERCFQTC